MDRSEVTAKLSAMVERRLARECSLYAYEVTLGDGNRVDYLGFKPYGRAYDPGAAQLEMGKVVAVEVKSCMADFNSGHGRNFVGDENWLVCPAELYELLRVDQRVPSGVGVLCPDKGWNRLLVKTELPRTGSCLDPMRKYPAIEMLWRIVKRSGHCFSVRMEEQ